MTERSASCRCGVLSARCVGDPLRISVCHCLACQQRSGSAFAAQARFPAGQVTIDGAYREWTRIADSGSRVTYRFCTTCGSNIAYWLEDVPEIVAVPLGAFADPEFPAPTFSVYESRRHDWVAVLGDDVAHSD